MLVGLVALAVQADHAGDVAGDALRVVRGVEKRIEFLEEIFAATDEVDEALNVVRHKPEILPTAGFLGHVVVIGFVGVVGRNPGAVGIFSAHEAGGGIEHVGIIMRTGEEHFVVVVLAEFFGEQGHCVIVPAIFQSFVHTGVASGVGRAGMFLEVVVDPAVLEVFGKVAAGAGGVHGVFAKVFIDGSVIEGQAALPIAEIHEHGVVAVE